MKNPNQEYFQKTYPRLWLSERAQRSADKFHYAYQEIMLDNLNKPDNSRILEMGCGCGELLERMNLKYPHSRLYGVDLGHDSLVTANQKEDMVFHLAEGDITVLPFPNDGFDCVISSSVLWYVPQPDFVIREMIRVLKPGGLFTFDVRSPYHITNILAKVSLFVKRKIINKKLPSYSFYTPESIARLLKTLPVEFSITGYFVLLPTRLPILGKRLGNWASRSNWLSFQAGHDPRLHWLSMKLLITGQKTMSGGND